MKIQQFSQQGKRSNNEDSIGHSAGLLTVCDGMGGHVSGERASAFVVQAMLEAFADPQPIGKMEIQQQLKKVQTDINQLLDKEPELEKMGTTFTGVFITPDVWYAAHIGDSRIYLFRPSEQKLWHTWDHSLVGELMRTKEITVEAGRFHPMSNRIAKAIIAQKEGKIASASIVKIDNLKAGDILLLCSDGVVEGWGDLELVQLFSDNSLSFEQKCKKLAKQCNDKSKDNNTALVAEIEESDAFNFGNNDELDWTTFAEVEADYKQYLADNAEESTPQKHETPANTPLATHASQPHAEPYYESEPPRQGGGSNKKPILIIAVAVLLLVGLGLFFLLRGNDEDRAFKKCETAAEYKAYIENYGKNAKYYSQAEAKIKELEREEQNNSGEVKPGKQVKPGKPDPSVEIRNGNNAEEAARRSEADEAENQAYNAIQSIQDCDAYLRKYPTGKYVEAVKKKKDDYKDDEVFGRCKTIKDCEYYLTLYQDKGGRHVNEVLKMKDELQKNQGGKTANPSTGTNTNGSGKSNEGSGVGKQGEASARTENNTAVDPNTEANYAEERDYKICKDEKTRTIDNCQKFMKDYPDSKHKAEVKGWLDELTKPKPQKSDEPEPEKKEPENNPEQPKED